MPRTIRFHLDENVSGAVAHGLRQYGIDVTTTPEVGLVGATDKEQIAFAIATGQVLFTQDKDFFAPPRNGAGTSWHRLLR